MTLIFQQTPFSKIYTTVDIMYLNRKKKKIEITPIDKIKN